MISPRMANWSCKAFALRRLTSAIVSVARAWDCNIFSLFFCCKLSAFAAFEPCGLVGQWGNPVGEATTTSSSEALGSFAMPTPGAIVRGDFRLPMPTPFELIVVARPQANPITSAHSSKPASNASKQRLAAWDAYLDKTGAFSQQHLQRRCRTLCDQTLACTPHRICPRRA